LRRLRPGDEQIAVPSLHLGVLQRRGAGRTAEFGKVASQEALSILLIVGQHLIKQFVSQLLNASSSLQLLVLLQQTIALRCLLIVDLAAGQKRLA